MTALEHLIWMDELRAKYATLEESAMAAGVSHCQPPFTPLLRPA